MLGLGNKVDIPHCIYCMVAYCIQCYDVSTPILLAVCLL